MKRFLLLTLTAGLSLQAATVNFGPDPVVGNASVTVSGGTGNLNYGNTARWNASDGSFFVDVYAFSLLSGTPTVFSSAALQHFDSSAGLGVCNTNEGAAECNSSSGTEWQTDHEGSRDFILVKFSSPVTLASFTINQTAGSLPGDVSWWFDSITVGTTFASIGTRDGFTNLANLSGTRSVAAPGGGVSALLVSGADPGDTFKLLNLTATAAVPEPGSMALLGSGLLALGYVARRRAARK